MSQGQQWVELGDRRYPIVFDRLDQLGTTMGQYRAPGPCIVVSNPVVGELYADACLQALAQAGWEPKLLFVPDGEQAKTIAHWSDLVSAMIGQSVDRKTPIFALGGGVTGDLVGFAAAVTLRGLPLVQVPTTLLSMVDSSVGGKTAVNTPAGKNLVGAFYQPELVFVDVEVLDTLSDDEMLCGFGEVIKHAVIAGDPFFSRLECLVSALLRRERAALEEVVRACCAIKADIVSQDERESGRRAVLNLGHSIGHAIEQTLGYGKIRHGEAVAMGVWAEAKWAHAHGICDESTVSRLEDLILAFGLRLRVKCSKNDLVEALFKDKKMSRAKLLLPVPVGIGEIRLDLIDPSELRLAAEFVSGEI